MKIKTITCHDVYNFGASLQAYALQTFLERQGHDVEIIDYLPDYRSDRMNFFEYRRKKGLIHGIVKRLPFLKPVIGLTDHLRNPLTRNDFLFRRRKQAFVNFKKEMLKCTIRTYKNERELESNVPKADLYIAGSDQIWNTIAPNGKDLAYYCHFVPTNIPCISYAASFGSNYIEKGFEDFVKENLSHFVSISIREHSGVEIVKKMGINAKEVLDPVFLLDTPDWLKLCKKKHAEKYILVYDLDMNHPGVKDLALSVAKNNNWKIYSLNDFHVCPYADYNINNAGPIEFLEWLYSAQFVISTSFHCTAFSVIFKKVFYTFPLYKQKNSARMSDFLSKMHLLNHYIENSLGNNALSDIDFDEISLYLDEYKRTSIQWLLTTIDKIAKQ